MKRIDLRYKIGCHFLVSGKNSNRRKKGSEVSRTPPPPPPPSCEGIFPHAPITPHRSKIGLLPHLAVYLVSGSVTDNTMYFTKDTAKFKRVYKTLFSPQIALFCIIFFQNFLGGAPPPPRTPTNRRGHPPVASPLGPSGLETPPPQVEFWIHCVLQKL